MTALRKIAREMRGEADNLSPTGGVHPAPALRAWAKRIERVAKGWSPMSSAPRDRPILARRHNDCFFEYHVVWWSDSHTYPWVSDNNAFPSDRLDDWHEIPE